jgi:hypothetical protein
MAGGRRAPYAANVGLPRDPRLVGQFVPPPVGEDLPFTGMWGVYVRADGGIFGSDPASGLWT